MKLRLLPAIFVGFASAALLVGCARERNFESVCQIVRSQIVETDEKGEATQMDVELEWDPCPGEQYQVVRGGKEFAACMRQYENGDYVPVGVKHWWDERGMYRWDVFKVGECTRSIEPESRGAYEKSQECSPTLAFGHPTGFECSRRPFKKLVSVCPWMARN